MIIVIILKMVLSAVLGGIIGLEREFSHKDPGLKISVLTAIGSALMSALAMELAGGLPPGKAKIIFSPVMVGIILAVGIIGAGVIIREKSTSQGLSNAAFVWLSGAIGITVGAGFYYISFITALFVIGCVFLLKKISRVIEKHRKVCVISISIEDNPSVIIEIKRIMMELGLKYINPNVRKTKKGYEVVLAPQTSQAKSKVAVERIMSLPDVKEISIESL